MDPAASEINTDGVQEHSIRQFRSLLEDMGAEYKDVLYHNYVQWLSFGKVLKRESDVRKK